MGEKPRQALRFQFDRWLGLEFHGARVTSDAGLLACRELDRALGLKQAAPTIYRRPEAAQTCSMSWCPYCGNQSIAA
jgi:hypothetical protein